MDNINAKLFTDESLQKLKHDFNNAPSFRHVCIDNFLNPSFAEELILHFPSIHTMKKHYNGINEKKSEESDFNKLNDVFNNGGADCVVDILSLSLFVDDCRCVRCKRIGIVIINGFCL